MTRTAADALIETLLRWGVKVIFGLPGDGINGIMESLRKHQDAIRFIQVRHEESAALMACGYAKFSGKLGVCLATSGPGGIHLLNGLYDAKLDGAPVLALTGLQFHDLIGTRTQQDVALDKLFMDVAVFNERIMGPNHVENITELACRIALSRKGVAHVTFPVDLQELPIEPGRRSKRNVPYRISDTFAPGQMVPPGDDLEKAAETLNAGRKVAILVGRGAIGARDQLEATAERLGAPVIKALLGKEVLPDRSPYTTGCIGLLGTEPSQKAVEDCDTLLLVGTSFPYMEFMPGPGQARTVQIDHDPVRIGLRHPVDVALVGGSGATLEALLPLLRKRRHKPFLARAQNSMKRWRKTLRKRSEDEGMPLKPQRVAAELSRHLTDDAVVATDSGTVTTWWARYVDAREDQQYSCSGNLATMGCGLPYVLAAQVAFPERQCVAFVGDGAFTMLMGDFATAVKYKLPIKVFVIKNDYLGQIQWEQMVFLGNPEFACDLQPIDFAAFATACGGIGLKLEEPGDCGTIIPQALATPGPVLVEAIVDPFEPPMPPKVTLAQAGRFAESLARGTPNRKKIALTVASNKIRELV